MTNTNRKTNKGKKVAAMLAAVMAASTMASISASALPSSLWGDNMPGFNLGITRTEEKDLSELAEEYVKYQFDGKKYKDILDVWQKVMDDPTTAFEKGNDINGDGVVTDEENKAVGEKVKEITAAFTAGLFKMGLSQCFPGSQFAADKALGDMTNAMFGVKKASNEDVIKIINSSAKELIGKIEQAENSIVTRTANLGVASKYGQRVDEFASAANTYRTNINMASSKGTVDEKTVAVASKLGNMNKWAENDLVKKMDIVKYYFTSDYCTTDSENGSNIYDIAMRTAIDKGSLFMKEAVENSQVYITQITGKYMKSCLTVLEMLSSMQKVSELTPEQVAAMSKVAQDDYRNIAAHSDDAYGCEAEILDDLLGEDGILRRTANYIGRKETEPTTYVGRGLGRFIKLDRNIEYVGDDLFVEAYHDRWLIPGYDYRWKKDSDTKLIKESGLSCSEVEGICKHAIKSGYKGTNYLKENGFNIPDLPKNFTAIMVTGHFDDYDGIHICGYTSYEGFNGFDMNKEYSKDSGSSKFNIIKKVQEDCYMPFCTEWYIDTNNYAYVFFKQVK